MENSVDKIQSYKDNLKKYENTYNDLERKKLIIETNIDNKSKSRDEIISKIMEAGFDPETLDHDIGELEKEIQVLTENIESLLSTNSNS